MATRPPMTLRHTGFVAGAPPSLALRIPVRPSASTTATTVTHTRAPTGGRVIASRGSRAATVKETNDATAACVGLVRLSGSIPSSTSAWAARASCSVSWWATWAARSWLRPLAAYSWVSSTSSSSGVSCSSRRSFSRRACSVSRWVLTETYSPTAMLIAPAARPAMPAVMIADSSAVAPATPTTMPAVDTMPSLAPSTPARSQLSRLATSLPCGSSWPLSDSSTCSRVMVGGLRSGTEELVVGAQRALAPTSAAAWEMRCASSMSSWVTPPAEWVDSRQWVTFQRMSMSGWWFICSAASAASSTSRIAAGKSGTSASCRVISSNVNSRLTAGAFQSSALLSTQVCLTEPAGRQGSRHRAADLPPGRGHGGLVIGRNEAVEAQRVDEPGRSRGPTSGEPVHAGRCPLVAVDAVVGRDTTIVAFEGVGEVPGPVGVRRAVEVGDDVPGRLQGQHPHPVRDGHGGERRAGGDDVGDVERLAMSRDGRAQAALVGGDLVGRHAALAVAHEHHRSAPGHAGALHRLEHPARVDGRLVADQPQVASEVGGRAAAPLRGRRQPG